MVLLAISEYPQLDHTKGQKNAEEGRAWFLVFTCNPQNLTKMRYH